jgi:CheY-like chemotaxis protein
LFNAIAAVLSGDFASLQDTQSLRLPNAELSPLKLRGRVLLAEDNPVNQEVALGMLEKLGLQVDVADDGAQALEAWQADQHDVILMDCQMPVMDGFEAVGRIRQLEAQRSESTRVPIIAVTANALQGDREICLAAGFDDYLSKPFRASALRALLTRWMNGGGAKWVEYSVVNEYPSSLREDTMASKEPEQELSVLDAKALDTIRALRRPGAPDPLLKVLRMYLDSSPKLITTIKQAAAGQDSEAIRKAVHALKSASANVGALKLAQLCKEVELAAKTGTLRSEGAQIEAITREYDRVQEAIQHTTAASV